MNACAEGSPVASSGKLTPTRKQIPLALTLLATGCLDCQCASDRGQVPGTESFLSWATERAQYTTGHALGTRVMALQAYGSNLPSLVSGKPD